MKRILYLSAGWLAFGVGAIGVVLPVLPTTPFMLVAAFCFAKASPRLHDWLVHKTPFGPHILAWEHEGAIAPRAKRLAIIVMALVVTITIAAKAPLWVIALQLALIIPGALFVWTRPNPRA